MKKQLFLTAVAAVMAFGAQTAAAQNIAIVNGKAVPKSRLDALAQQVAKSGRPVTPDVQQQMREAVIAREIFAQEAEKLGLMASDEYKNQMEIARQTVLITVLIDDFKKKNAITDTELKAEYDKFAATNGGKEYKARHILVEKELDAKTIIASIKKGGNFEDIAKKQSKDPGSGANGGDLDWANPSSYVPEFTEAMLKLTKGQMTENPVKTQFGFHIIRVDDIRTAQLPAFEELKPQIAQQLDQQRLGAFQQNLRDKAKVE